MTYSPVHLFDNAMAIYATGVARGRQLSIWVIKITDSEQN